MITNGPRNIFIGFSLQLNVATQIFGQTVLYYAKSGKFVSKARDYGKEKLDPLN